MKMFKSVLMGAVLTLALTGCSSGESKDYKAIYNEAVQKGAELEDMEASIVMDMKMSMGDQEMTMKMDSEVKTAKNDAGEQQFYMTAKTDMLDQSVDMTYFYTDGYFYMDAMGSKIKAQMDFEQMVENVGSAGIDYINADMMDSFNAKEENGEIIIDYTMSADSANQYIKDMMEQMGTAEALAGGDFEVKAVSGTANINSDGYISKQLVNMELSITAEGQSMDMTISANSEVKNPGQPVTIEMPTDLDSYQEVDSSMFDSLT